MVAKPKPEEENVLPIDGSPVRQDPDSSYVLDDSESAETPPGGDSSAAHFDFDVGRDQPSLVQGEIDRKSVV